MNFTGRQYRQAIERIALEGIHVNRKNQHPVVIVLGSTGARYRVDPVTGACNCPAGVNGVPCKHALAAAISGRVDEPPFVTARVDAIQA